MKKASIFLSLLMIFSIFIQSVQLAGPERASAAGTAVIEPGMLAKLASATEPQQVIVTFKENAGGQPKILSVLKESGLVKGVVLNELPIAGVLATKAQIEKLAQNENVLSIYPNKKLKYENKEATELTGVDRLRTEPSFTKLNGGMPVDGSGIGVVINDSGVDGTHKDIEFGGHLVQNVLGATNLNALSELLPVTWVENVPNTDTSSGHGTHVAGIVGGTGAMSKGDYEGVAPGAKLIGYGSGAAVAMLDTLGGFDYALTHQAEYNIRVITNSWGDTGDAGTDFDPFDPINIATKKLYDRGIVTVFSAGNSGPGDSTISGNYKKAPWVITIAAGTKQGQLADFSSRGVKGKGGTVTVGSETWKWEDRPTVTSPGETIISTRVISPIAALGATDDVNLIPPAYLPYYTTMSGTSMAAPHVAGIVALVLDANPSLSPLEVKKIIEQTATNMPGYEPWEVGSGYVNAYAAVDAALNGTEYGSVLNMNRAFNSNAQMTVNSNKATIDFSPMNLKNEVSFAVGSGQTELVARMNAYGLLGQTGNPVNLVLTAPDGTRYTSGISVLFTLYPDRTVQVMNPVPGTWKASIEGLQGLLALPEKVDVELVTKTAGSFSGLNDITGHPAESAIKLAVSDRLIDGKSTKNFDPDAALKRSELANYLVMGAGVRQQLPLNGTSSVSDVKAADRLYVEAVLGKGAALKNVTQNQKGVMLPSAAGKFSPDEKVTRAQLAYSLVQALGLEDKANELKGQELTVQYNGTRVPIQDAANVPAELRGHVQLALDLNILNAYFSTVQDRYALKPTITAKFEPGKTVTRADYAVAITRYFASWHPAAE
ncbi:S8 family serine peptidase [Bacillus sp. B-jedd]|uniref:S8 family serine peptidase n=1 Tax=Bacillus sp. B-jedd TaxID=1476857 RepID=UPI0005155903|nr:S8 family serine peptidase [Bacillus sp. B-jedd]CEG29289.1 peptidase S8 and S53 subtilisin kexin sedolisin [Bacillus sp. B-jedd]